MHSSTPTVPPTEALNLLRAGNQRFVQGKMTHPHQDAARRTEVTAGQHPIAIIFGCSDSRAPVEVLFDQGIGDLFIVRTAGNVADDVALGSIEYAVEHLGVGLIVVLGHQACGAVIATIQGGEAGGHIGSLVKHIQPAVAAARQQTGDLLHNAIVAQIQAVTQQVASSEPLRSTYVNLGKVKVVGALYHLDSGQVEFFA